MDFKVYILVEAPVLEKTYELFVPIDRRIHDILELLKKNIPELSEGYFKNNNVSLYSKSTGRAYDMNQIIKNSNIKMGTRLIII